MTPRLKASNFYSTRPDFVSNHTIFPNWVLVAPESGRFRFETDGASGEAGVGDLVLAAPGGRFNRYATAPLSYHVLQFDWAGKVSATQNNADEAPFALRDGVFAVREIGRLRDDFEFLKRYTARFDVRARTRVENLLGDLLHLMWESEGEDRSGRDPLMESAARTLQLRAGECFAMRRVSDELGLGAATFTRRFRACHGCTPIEFLTRQRMAIARGLLLETSLPLDKIAVQCGYASGFYLSNLWKKQTGMAPGAFRRGHRI